MDTKRSYVVIAVLFLLIGVVGEYFWSNGITTSLLPAEITQAQITSNVVEGPTTLPVSFLIGMLDLDEPDLICEAYQKYVEITKQKVKQGHRIVVGTGGQVISTMRVWDRGYTMSWAMLVDIHGHCYLNGHYPIKKERGGTVDMEVTRTPNGYCADASDVSRRSGDFWEPVNSIPYVGAKIDQMIPVRKIY